MVLSGAGLSEVNEHGWLEASYVWPEWLFRPWMQQGIGVQLPSQCIINFSQDHTCYQCAVWDMIWLDPLGNHVLEHRVSFVWTPSRAACCHQSAVCDDIWSTLGMLLSMFLHLLKYLSNVSIHRCNLGHSIAKLVSNITSWPLQCRDGTNSKRSVSCFMLRRPHRTSQHRTSQLEMLGHAPRFHTQAR